MAEQRDRRPALLVARDEHAAPLSSQDAGTAPARSSGVTLGRIVAVQPPDVALVTFEGRAADPPLRARSLVSLLASDVGRDIALMFETGDPIRPIVIGRIEKAPAASARRASAEPLIIDAESVLLTSGREIVLRCGEATLTLRRDGKLVLRGAYVETHAAGVNRIKGGCVKIN
jgi:hypothetical protein